jgi:hypothetical protein
LALATLSTGADAGELERAGAAGSAGGLATVFANGFAVGATECPVAVLKRSDISCTGE